MDRSEKVSDPMEEASTTADHENHLEVEPPVIDRIRPLHVATQDYIPMFGTFRPPSQTPAANSSPNLNDNIVVDPATYAFHHPHNMHGPTSAASQMPPPSVSEYFNPAEPRAIFPPQTSPFSMNPSPEVFHGPLNDGMVVDPATHAFHHPQDIHGPSSAALQMPPPSSEYLNPADPRAIFPAQPSPFGMNPPPGSFPASSICVFYPPPIIFPGPAPFPNTFVPPPPFFCNNGTWVDPATGSLMGAFQPYPGPIGTPTLANIPGFYNGANLPPEYNLNAFHPQVAVPMASTAAPVYAPYPPLQPAAHFYNPPNRPDTTLMISNIPLSLRREKLLDMLDEHCLQCNSQLNVGEPESAYDYCYIPIDRSRMDSSNRGYAFVNFTTREGAERFRSAMDGRPGIWPSDLHSGKICAVKYARIQGIGIIKNQLRRTFVYDPPRNGRRPPQVPQPTVTVLDAVSGDVASSTPNTAPSTTEEEE